MNGSRLVASNTPLGPSLALLSEQFLPFLGAVAVVAVWIVLGRPFPSPPDNLLSASATVASVFAGFLGASAAIILTIKDTEMFKILAKHGYMKEVFRYLRDGLFSCTLFAILSILGFFVQQFHNSTALPSLGVFAPVFVLSASLSLFTFARVAHLLFKLLRQNLD